MYKQIIIEIISIMVKHMYSAGRISGLNLFLHHFLAIDLGQIFSLFIASVSSALKQEYYWVLS